MPNHQIKKPEVASSFEAQTTPSLSKRNLITNGKIMLKNNFSDGNKKANQLTYSNNPALRRQVEKYHKNGYVITPLRDKIPIQKDWQKQQWQKEINHDLFANCSSLGFVIPKNIVVIDVDNHDEFNTGNQSLEKMSKDFGFDLEERAEFIVQTAGGGLHLYYKIPEVGLKIANVLADYPCVEFKSSGRQVVIPESTLSNGKRYKSSLFSDFDKISSLPESVLLAITQRQPKEPTSDKLNNSVGADHAADIKQFMTYLELQPPIGAGERNNRLFPIACQGVNYNISSQKLFEILSKWQMQKVTPPIDESELKQIIDSANKNSQEGVGSKSIIVLFGDKKLRKIEANDLREVDKFDIDLLLPIELSDFVRDVSCRLSAPPEFVAIPLITGLSSLIASKAVMRPKIKDNFCVFVNLWGGIVGTPGSRKSDSLKQAIFFFDPLESKAKEIYDEKKVRYDKDLSKYKITKQALEEELKRLIKASDIEGSLATETKLYELSEPRKVSMERFRINQATTQKITEILRDNENPSILLERDELAGFLSELDRKENESDRSYFLEMWNGNASARSDTIGRGSVFAKNASISITGTTQPDKIKSYLERAANTLNDGLLQRFQLLVYPDPVKNDSYIDNKPNEEARIGITKIVDFLNDYNLFNCSNGSIEKDGKNYACFSFDPQAQARYQEWNVENNQKVSRFYEEGKNLLSEHMSKYHKLLPALSLIFHLVKTSKDQKLINAKTLDQAIHFCEYLESHARRIYSIMDGDGIHKIKALTLLGKIKNKASSGKDSVFFEEFTKRDLQRKITTCKNEELDRVIGILVEHNHLIEKYTEPKFQQREKYSYFLHPDLISVWSSDSSISPQPL